MIQTKQYFFSTVMFIILFSATSCLRAKKSNFDISGPSGQLFFGVFSFLNNTGSGLTSFTYDETTLDRTRSVPILPLEPVIEGTVNSYSLDKTLPAGLFIDSKTGIISGTPTQDQAEKTYKVTGVNGTKSLSVDLKITISSNAPANLSYNGTSSGMATGSTGNNLLFRRTVNASIKPKLTGTASSFSISPSVPAGLSFNTVSGIISGTPTVSTLTNTYTITATNTFGTLQLSISITALPVIYLATFGGGLAISTDGGNSFTMRTNANSGIGCNTVNAVSVDQDGKIFVANNFNMCPGGISASSNNGTSFSFLNASLTGFQGLSILSETPGTIYFGTTGGFYYSTNSGSTFTSKTGTLHFDSDRINDIHAPGSLLYIANGFSNVGGLSISLNGGASFTKTSTGLPAMTPITGVSMSGFNVFLTTSGSSSNGFYLSTNSGTSFAASGSLPSSYKVRYLNSTVFVATLINGLYKSTNNGVSFTNYTISNGLPSMTIIDVFVYADGTIYAATSSGLGISTNGGTTFVTRNGSHGITNLSIQSIAVR
jgi:large repetitive protein